LGYSSEGIAFFDLQGKRLALFPRQALRAESQVDLQDHGTPAISLVYYARYNGEVESVVRDAI
jgi:hypothetical protein